jgi:hypothetical protein
MKCFCQRTTWALELETGRGRVVETGLHGLPAQVTSDKAQSGGISGRLWRGLHVQRSQAAADAGKLASFLPTNVPFTLLRALGNTVFSEENCVASAWTAHQACRQPHKLGTAHNGVENCLVRITTKRSEALQ